VNFEQRVFHCIKKNKLIAPRGLVLLGVSGGADSMALLMSLNALRHDLGVQIEVLHFNHRLRPESSKDEDFVRTWCGKLNIPLVTGQRSGGKIEHLSEDEARQMRFGFFIKTARKRRAQVVALAHTRNDLAETVLMRLLRGSGLYGLRAIGLKRSIEGIDFVRPLMEMDRAEIESYLKAKKVSFCTDATNRQTVYERNKVRLKLLPLLAREYNPQITKVLVDLAATSVEDYDFVSRHAKRQFDKLATVSKTRVKIALKDIKRQHPAIARLILRQMAEGLTKDISALSFDHIHFLENLINDDGKSTLDLPHGLKAVKTKGSLELHHA